MYNTIQFLHSYWAYLVLTILVLATFNALIKFFGNKEFQANDFRISLFALIVTHIQLLITIGYSKHKKKLTSRPKFKVLSIFYTLGLILVLSRIPWSNWF